MSEELEKMESFRPVTSEEVASAFAGAAACGLAGALVVSVKEPLPTSWADQSQVTELQHEIEAIKFVQLDVPSASKKLQHPATNFLRRDLQDKQQKLKDTKIEVAKQPHGYNMEQTIGLVAGPALIGAAVATVISSRLRHRTYKHRIKEQELKIDEIVYHEADDGIKTFERFLGNTK